MNRRTFMQSLAAALAAVGVGRRAEADEPERVGWIEPDPASVDGCDLGFEDYIEPEPRQPEVGETYVLQGGPTTWSGELTGVRVLHADGTHTDYPVEDPTP